MFVLTQWCFDGEVDFRPESDAPQPGLCEPVRSLEARLRHLAPGQLTAEEEQALQGLLETVQSLTRSSLLGRC